MNFKMLPDSVKSPDNVKAFTENEQNNDLIENGRHNKKQSKTYHEKVNLI